MSLIREVFLCPHGVRFGADLSPHDHGEPALSYVVMGQRQAATRRSRCAIVRPIMLWSSRISTYVIDTHRGAGSRCASGMAAPGPPRGKKE